MPEPQTCQAAFTAAHAFYIPAMVIVGLVIGFVLGSRAARDVQAVEERKRRLAEEARRRGAKDGQTAG
jgi:uncharacterized membrane protein